MDALLGRRGDAADHALMEITEPLVAKGGRAAFDSGDFDVGAGSNAGVDWHSGSDLKQ